MDPVGSDGSVEGVMDGAVLHIRTIHTPTQVEMDGVTTQSEGLATEAYFRVFNSVSETCNVKCEFITLLKEERCDPGRAVRSK